MRVTTETSRVAYACDTGGALTLVDATGEEVTLLAVQGTGSERRVDRVLRDAAGETLVSDTIAFPSFAPEDLPVVA